MTVDLDALIAEARGVLLAGGPTWETDAAGYIADLAGALESTLAELRQERERADGAVKQQKLLVAEAEDLAQRLVNVGAGNMELLAALSRAEETIEKVRNIPRHELNALVTAVDAHDIDAILSDYDKNGADHD